jgi:hypothetical protein
MRDPTPWDKLDFKGWRGMCLGGMMLLAFPLFLFTAQPKEFFWEDGLMKLEQRSHKCVELTVEYVE